ncbi:MAG: pilus assembly protein [Hyphomicrobiaceae bacterium]|nr:pilus assembly protein [Hyphomicrobiaceae bacterium]
MTDMQTKSGFLARLRGFARAREGVAAVEFAMIAPFMIALWLGSVELAQGVTINRKVAHASSALADLVTQQANLTEAEIEDIFDATEAILMPYSVSNMSVVMSGIQIDSDGNPSIVWSRARNGSPDRVGGSGGVPTGLRIPDTFLVTAVVSYDFTPSTSRVISGTITLDDRFFLRPRRSREITVSP